jgi:hypothetical protein
MRLLKLILVYLYLFVKRFAIKYPRKNARTSLDKSARMFPGIYILNSGAKITRIPCSTFNLNESIKLIYGSMGS